MTVTEMPVEEMWFIECDSCTHSDQVSSTKTFPQAMRHFKDVMGWRHFKDDLDRWKNSCPRCVAAFADKLQREEDGRPAVKKTGDEI